MTDWRDRPNAPAPGTPLCPVAEVPADNGREIAFGAGERAFRVVLFRVEGSGPAAAAASPASAAPGVRAYVNECPHFRIPFNFRDDVFCVYDIDGRRDLMCAHHTAMFHLDDGACYEGPCAGARLAEVPLAERDDWLVVA